MTYNETMELQSQIGEDKLLWMVEKFANKKLPGKKIIYQLKKEKFLSECGGKSVIGLAKSLGVSTATAYNWYNQKLNTHRDATLKTEQNVNFT